MNNLEVAIVEAGDVIRCDFSVECAVIAASASLPCVLIDKAEARVLRLVQLWGYCSLRKQNHCNDPYCTRTRCIAHEESRTCCTIHRLLGVDH